MSQADAPATAPVRALPAATSTRRTPDLHSQPYLADAPPTPVVPSFSTISAARAYQRATASPGPSPSSSFIGVRTSHGGVSSPSPSSGTRSNPVMSPGGLSSSIAAGYVRGDARKGAELMAQHSSPGGVVIPKNLGAWTAPLHNSSGKNMPSPARSRPDSRPAISSGFRTPGMGPSSGRDYHSSQQQPETPASNRRIPTARCSNLYHSWSPSSPSSFPVLSQHGVHSISPFNTWPHPGRSPLPPLEGMNPGCTPGIHSSAKYVPEVVCSVDCPGH